MSSNYTAAQYFYAPFLKKEPFFSKVKTNGYDIAEQRLHPFKNIFHTRGRFVAIILVLMCLLMVEKGWGQTTVFSDLFGTSTGATYSTSVGAIGTSSTWSFSRSGADFGARIDGGILDATNDAGASGNVNGWVFGYTTTASFTSPFTNTLSSNSSLVTWTFNMRQIRPDPAGFVAGSYGVAFILGGTSTTAATAGSGYAVVLGQSGTTDPVRLAHFNNGLQGTLTNLITSNTTGLTDFGTDYLSVRVTYSPSTNTWELFLRNDGASAFTDPSTGSLTSQGTVVNSTYTSSSLTSMGGYWQGSTGATQTAFFDNVNVSVAAASCTQPTTQANSFVSTISGTSSLNLGWTRGNGDGVIVVARSGSAVNSDPVTNTTYTANTIFGSGSQIGTGNYVVFSGTGSNVSVTGLSPSTTYHFAVYEYANTGICYKTPSLIGNAATDAGPCSTPTEATVVAATSGANLSSTITWTNPTCFDEVLVVAKANSTISLPPSGDGSTYTASSILGVGTGFDGGSVVYKGTNTVLTVTSLINGTEYFFKVFARKGTVWTSGVVIQATPNNGVVYYSRGNGLNTTFIWSQTRSGTASPATFSSTTDMVVQNGNVVSFTGTSTIIKDLRVETGGQFFRNSTNNSSFINVYGNIHCDGIIGNGSTYDHVGIDVEGFVCSITGNGQFDCARISKNTSSTTTVYFKRNVNLRFQGECLYLFFGGNALLNYEIDNGVTVNTIGNGGSPAGNVALDGTDGTDSNQKGGYFLINGTLSVTGTTFLTTNNNNALFPCSMTIGGTGTLFTNTLNLAASGTAGHTLNIKNGGKLTVNGSISSFGTTNNTFNFENGSTFEYAGGGQAIQPMLPYSNLLISGSGDKTLASNLLVANNFSITGTAVLPATTNTISVAGNWLQSSISNFTSSAATIVLNGGSATIDSKGDSFENLVVASTGTKTLLSNLAVTQNVSIIGGTLDAGTNNFDGGGNLFMSGGTLRLAKTEVTNPELSGSTYANSGGVINLYGNGSQTLRGARDYATISITGNSYTTLSSNPNSVLGISIADQAVLDVESNDFGDSRTTLTMTGTSVYRSSRAGTVPTMGNLYFLSIGTSMEFYGSNSSVDMRSTPTSGGSQPHRYQNLLFSGVTTITAPANVLRVEGNITNNLSTGLFKANNGTVSFTGTNQTLGGSSETNFYNLSLGTSTNLSLTRSATVNNTVSLGTNAILNSNGYLNLLSNSTGTARIGIIPSGAIVNGNIVLQRYVPGRSTANLVLYQFASPLAGNTVANWQGTSTSTGIYVTGNFSNKSSNPATGIVSNSGASTFTYNASTGLFQQFPTVGGNNTDQTSVGVGYRSFVRDGTTAFGFTNVAPKTISTVGSVYSGTFPFNIVHNDALTQKGWNLLGNPFPSEITGDLLNATAWPNRKDVNGAIYIWNGSLAGYNTFVDGVGVLAGSGAWDGVIPSSQAFWVRSTATGATLSVAESAKITGASGAFWRMESEPILRITLRHDTEENEAVIRLKNLTTSNFDQDRDAEKLDAQAGGAKINIASFTKDKSKRLTINSMPPRSRAGADTIGLDVGLVNGSHQLKFSGVNDFSSKVFLIDSFLEKSFNLSEIEIYQFNVSSISGSGVRNRFSLIFATDAYLQTDSVVYLSDSSGSFGKISIETNTDWKANETSDWFEITFDSTDLNAVSIKAIESNTSNEPKIGILTVSGLGFDSKTVKVIQKAGKSDTVTQTTSLLEKSIFNFEIYPNPVGSLDELQITTPLLNEDCNLLIYNGMGKLIYNKIITTTTKTSHQVDLDSKFSNGVYLVSVVGSKQIRNKKLIINH